MFANPAGATAAIMIALGVIFIMEGLLIFVYWMKSQRKHRGIMLLNGIVTFILGVLILGNIYTGLWFIGTLVGIDLIFTGITMVAMPIPEFPQEN